MTMNAFNLFLGIMSLIALIVFIALYFVKAGYGIFSYCFVGCGYFQ